MLGQRHTLELFVRRGCHLCDAARQALAPLVQRPDVRYVEHDIDDPATDPLLRALYDTAVPVLHVDGTQVAAGRVERQMVEAHLAAADRRTSPIHSEVDEGSGPS